MVIEKVISTDPPEFRVSEMNAAGESSSAAVINTDNFRSDTIVKLVNNQWTIDRKNVDGQGGQMSVYNVTFSNGS
jgi:hypothetical protein